MRKERIVFMGTPVFSATVLKELIKLYNVVLVVTSKDKLVGRKKILTPSSVKIVAKENNIEVFEVDTLKNNYQYIISKTPDIIITCAFGYILPKELIYYPRFDTINIHTSLLPDLRGASPVRSAIIRGYNKTGVTLMKTSLGIDDGDIISKVEMEIDQNDNIITLENKMAQLGAKLLIDNLDNIFNEEVEYIKQDNTKATYVSKFTRDDEKLSFNDKAINIYNKIRAFYDIGVYITIDNINVKIYESRIGEKTNIKYGTITNIYKDGIGISTTDYEIIVTKLQIPGKKAMYAKDYLNGINKSSLIGKNFEN